MQLRDACIVTNVSIHSLEVLRPDQGTGLYYLLQKRWFDDSVGGNDAVD